MGWRDSPATDDVFFGHLLGGGASERFHGPAEEGTPVITHHFGSLCQAQSYRILPPSRWGGHFGPHFLRQLRAGEPLA